MTKTKSKYFIVIIAILAIGCTFWIMPYFLPSKASKPPLSPQEITELRNEYPVYNGQLAIASSMPLTFQEIIEGVDSVVIGEVLAELPPYEFILSPLSPGETAIQEKKKNEGGEESTEKFVQYEFRVTDIISGYSVEDHIFLSYNAVLKGIEPDLKPGMKLILGIIKGKSVHEGKYTFTRYGTYYIVNEHNVLSTFDDEFSKTMNGQTLDQFIKIIKSFRS